MADLALLMDPFRVDFGPLRYLRTSDTRSVTVSYAYK